MIVGMHFIRKFELASYLASHFYYYYIIFQMLCNFASEDFAQGEFTTINNYL